MTPNTTSRRKHEMPFAAFVSPSSSAPKAVQHPEIPSEGDEKAVLHDEVAVLGSQLSAALEAADRFEEKADAARNAKDISEELFYQKAANHAFDEVYVLRSMLTVRQANTLCGAAVQITEALSLLDTLAGPVGGNEAEETQRNNDLRAINRLLYSVLKVIDRAAEQKLAVVAPQLGNGHCDPWIPVEEQLRKIARR